MAVGAAQCFNWRRVKWILLWSILVFVFITYMGDWWSLKVEKTIIDGQTKYKLKARIHMGYINTQPQLTTQNPLKSYQKVEDNKADSIGNRHMTFRNVSLTNPPAGQVIKGSDVSSRKSTKSNIVDNLGHKPTTQKPLPPTSTSKGLHIDKTLQLKNEHATSHARVEDIPSIDVQGANCEALFRNDRAEMKKASTYQAKHPKVMTPDREVLKLAKNCDAFKKERKYIMSPVNEEEAEFPIAFSLLLFKDVEVVERLLRSIYRPQNFYCIHVDKKSSSTVRNAMTAIADCFDNVFMSSRSVDVQWGWYSVLEPEIICMEDLWKKYAPKWKYFINLTGQEFPLKTNWELVKILKAYNGANDMESTIKRRNQLRTQYVHNGFYETKQKKAPCPVDVTLSKGSVHIAVQSGFVDFVLHNPSGQKFLNWVKDTGVPDETFFSSLNVSPQLGVPGATTGDKETNKDTNPFMTRFKNWGDWPFNYPCAGKRVRMICIFSIGDLPQLASRPEMFANKFYPDYNPLAYDCMEQRHFNKIRTEARGDAVFHDEFYRQLDFVKHHLS